MVSFDLNLVRTLVLICETGSLTRTAEVLGVTQPTVSHSLTKLRRRFDDRLFLRGPGGMHPTELALELYDSFRAGLAQIDVAVESAVEFDPATSHRRFRLCLTDLGEMTLLPAVVERIAALAPGVEVEVVPMEIEHVGRWLATGKVDAAIASFPFAGDLRSEVLRRERYLLLLRDGHPLLRGTLTMERFEAASHAVVTTATGHLLAESVMSDLGVRRHKALTLPHFSALPHVLDRTDLVAVVPAGLAGAFMGRWGLTTLDLPFAVPEFEVRLSWQRRDREGRAMTWLHRTVVDALR